MTDDGSRLTLIVMQKTDMRHPDDGNLAALDRYLDKLDEAMERGKELKDETEQVLKHEWDAIIAEIGDDLQEYLSRVYFDGIKGLAQMQVAIHAAAERIAARNLDIEL